MKEEREIERDGGREETREMVDEERESEGGERKRRSIEEEERASKHSRKSYIFSENDETLTLLFFGNIFGGSVFVCKL